MKRFSVRIEKDFLVFSAAHFITFNQNVCERLHGHNYRVGVEVEGLLDENHYVIDFVWLRDTAKQLVDALDHRMLLPTSHPLIAVSSDDREVLVTFEDRRWIFPLGDCILLPVPNTTSELLAEYLGNQLLKQIQANTSTHVARLKIEIDECFGQIGAWETTLTS